jgi:hypothetical protein
MVLPALALVAGCSGAPKPEWTETGIRHEAFRYAIEFRNPSAEQFLGDDWRVDNWYVLSTDLGRETKLKTGAEYETKESWDRNRDGIIDEKRVVNRYDLLLCNRKDDGRIWVKVWELGQEREKKDLAVILESYVSDLSGGLEVSVGMGRARIAEGKSYAAELTETLRARIGPYEALVATVSIADLDRIRLAPDLRYRKIRLVLARVPIDVQWTPPAAAPEKQRDGTGLLIAVYVNSPDRFDSHLADFEQLLGLIRFPGRTETGFEIVASDPAPGGAPILAPAPISEPEPEGTATMPPEPGEASIAEPRGEPSD